MYAMRGSSFQSVSLSISRMYPGRGSTPVTRGTPQRCLVQSEFGYHGCETRSCAASATTPRCRYRALVVAQLPVKGPAGMRRVLPSRYVWRLLLPGSVVALLASLMVGLT